MKSILVTTNHPAPYMDRLFEAMSRAYSVKVVYLRGASRTKAWRNLSSFPGDLVSRLTLSRWRGLVREADLVIVGGWGSTSNRMLILYSLLCGKRLAIFSDAPYLATKRDLTRRVQSMLLRFIPFFLVAGDEARRIFIETYGVSAQRVKNFPYFPSWPVDDARPDHRDRESDLRDRNVSVRLFIANRFVDRKGYDTVLRALEALKEKGILARFDIAIAGTGVLYDRYATALAALGGNVRLLGWLEPQDYDRRLREADIFLHASEFEQYGIPVVDAALHGKCVVASSGVCSAVDMANLGFPLRLFAPGDHAALADILTDIEATRVIYRDPPTGAWADKLPPRQIVSTLDAIFAAA